MNLLMYVPICLWISPFPTSTEKNKKPLLDQQRSINQRIIHYLWIRILTNSPPHLRSSISARPTTPSDRTLTCSSRLWTCHRLHPRKLNSSDRSHTTSQFHNLHLHHLHDNRTRTRFTFSAINPLPVMHWPWLSPRPYALAWAETKYCSPVWM